MNGLRKVKHAIVKLMQVIFSLTEKTKQLAFKQESTLAKGLTV